MTCSQRSEGNSDIEDAVAAIRDRVATEFAAGSLAEKSAYFVLADGAWTLVSSGSDGDWLDRCHARAAELEPVAVVLVVARDDRIEMDVEYCDGAFVFYRAEIVGETLDEFRLVRAGEVGAESTSIIVESRS